MSLENMLRRLPDHLEKPRIIEFLEVIDREFQLLRDIAAQIERINDLTEATGGELDAAGANIDEPRRGRDDTEYRRALKVRVAQNTSRGTVEDINNFGRLFLEGNYIGVENSSNPAEINIISRPLPGVSIPSVFANVAAAGISVVSSFEITSPLTTPNNITGTTHLNNDTRTITNT